MGHYYEDVEENGTTRTTSSYSCESQNLQYTIIGDNINEYFKILIQDLPQKLDEVKKELYNAASVTDAFSISNGAGSGVDNLNAMYQEIQNDIEVLKVGLGDLRSALLTDIDNINAELESNYGHWAFNKAVLAGKKTETIEEPIINP